MNDVPAVTTKPRRGFFRLLGGVLISPRNTFTYLREHGGRAWLLVAALLLLLSSLPPLVGGPVQARETRQQIMDNLENQPGMPTDVDMEQVAAMTASPIFTTVIPTVGAVLALLFSWLLWSGALYLLAAMTGGRGSFGQLLPVVVWATLPYGLRSLAQTIYIATTDSLINTPGLSGFVQSESTDPFALPSTETAVLESLLGQVEIYLFWYLALLVIGLMAVMQVSKRKALGLVITVWAIFLLFRLLGIVVSNSLASGFM
jgi:hypothetical protein